MGERQGSIGDFDGGGEGGQEVGLNSRGSSIRRAFFKLLVVRKYKTIAFARLLVRLLEHSGITGFGLAHG